MLKFPGKRGNPRMPPLLAVLNPGEREREVDLERKEGKGGGWVTVQVYTFVCFFFSWPCQEV